MNITIEKGSKLTVGLEWVDCTSSTIKPVTAELIDKKLGFGLYLTNANGQSSVGAIGEKGLYSAAAILAQHKDNCLCVLSDKDGWWIAACMDSLPASDKWIATEEEAISEAQALLAVMGDTDILGDAHFFKKAFPETSFSVLSWEDLFSLADKSTLKKAKIVKFNGKTNYTQLLVLAILLPAIYWMYFSDGETEFDPTESWQKTHTNEVNNINNLYSSTIKNDPTQMITSYMDVIFNYPISIAGWRLSGINCSELKCNQKWVHSDGSGSNADFRQAITLKEQAWQLTSLSQYSSDGKQILHSVSVPTDYFNGDLQKTVNRDQFYTETLASIQIAARSKLVSWSMGTANLSGRLTLAPDNRPLPAIEFNYGTLTLEGSGLFNIERAAEKLTSNQMSINELNITLDEIDNPTWSIKGNYVYR